MQRVRIVIHCSAGSQKQSAADIVKFFLAPVSRGGRGWRRPGYHYIIEASGHVHQAVPEQQLANGAKGYNSDSIHVCYVGGIDAKGKPTDNRTPAQRAALLKLLPEILKRNPGVRDICGHRDLSPDLNGNGVIEPREWIKACPCFDARAEYAPLLRQQF